MITQERNWNNSHREITSKFINDFISKIWTPDFTAKFRDEYYDINRAFSKAIEENIEVVKITKFVDREVARAIDMKYVVKQTEHLVASMLIEEILKSEKIVIQYTVDYLGNYKFECSLPFVAFKDKAK